MNKEQFVKKFQLERVDDQKLMNSYMVNFGFDQSTIKTLEYFMKAIPIELYKRDFETGTSFYISINIIKRKIISEFYFSEDRLLVSIFDFINQHLDPLFSAQSAFNQNNEQNFVEYYTDVCLDMFNSNFVTKEQMTEFLTKLTDSKVKEIVEYGKSLLECLSTNKTTILNSENDNNGGDYLLGGLL